MLDITSPISTVQTAQSLYPPSQSPPPRIILGIFHLNKGASTRNFISYLLASFFGIAVFVFINASTVFVLTDILNTPKDELGNDAGTITFYDEILSLIMVFVWGVCSDFMGRRLIYSGGFLIMGGGLFLYTYAKNIFPELLLYRLLFSVGGAATSSMLTAVLGDYSADESRGRISALVGICSGLGAITALFFFLRIPLFFPDGAFNGLRKTYFIVASISVAFGFFLVYGLKKEEEDTGFIPTSNTSDVVSPSISSISSEINAASCSHNINQSIRPPRSTENCPAIKKSKHFLPILKEGLYAIKDMRILLGYIGGFLARGDTVIITVFLPLYVYKSFIKEGKCKAADTDVKETCRDAYVLASILSGVAQTCALLGAPMFGYISDRFYRPLSTILASIIGLVGYLMLFFLESPTMKISYFIVSLIGVGETGMVICSMSLVTSSYVPNQSRGSIAGAYSLFGAIGILFNTKLGGYLFDKWNPAAPFFLLALGHALCFIIAMIVVAVDIDKVVHKRQAVALNQDDDERIGFFDSLKTHHNTYSFFVITCILGECFFNHEICTLTDSTTLSAFATSSLSI